jgi:hypothetical protein
MATINAESAYDIVEGYQSQNNNNNNDDNLFDDDDDPAPGGYTTIKTSLQRRPNHVIAQSVPAINIEVSFYSAANVLFFLKRIVMCDRLGHSAKEGIASQTIDCRYNIIN